MSRKLLRRFDQFRRRHTTGLNASLYGLLGRDKFLLNERLPANQVKRILVVRNNPRIGNMYFLLPFLNALRDLYPTAKIDLMVISQGQANIFEGMPFEKIWVSNFSFERIFEFFKMLRQVRKQPYDLLLMPHGSTTDTIIGGLVHARNKICLWDEEKSRIYRHAIKVDQISPHAARSPLALIEALAGHPLSTVNHHMMLKQQEKDQATFEVNKIKGSRSLCIAYFRGARGNKIIPNEHWHAVRAKFDSAATEPIAWVEILSPDVKEPLTAETRTWQSANLRELGAFLAACDLFICGDTGPLHLADAAGAKCLGLFTATPIEHYGCMGDECLNLTSMQQIDAAGILSSLTPPQLKASH